MTLAGENLDPDFNLGPVLPLTGWWLHPLIFKGSMLQESKISD
jgi:hypothetical protein